ncbi:MAG: hypothetical protein ACE5HL_07745 [Terriglobia bacterium]
MIRAASLTLCVSLWVAPALRAQEESPAGEAEEPDFFFLTGGPYTQKKNSPQIIWANQWFRHRSPARRTRSYFAAGRFEWGLTDSLEADFEFGALALKERTSGITTFSGSGADDLLVGVRYRLLREEFASFTLTLGPQLVAPVASSARRELGTGEAAYAFDITAAKDWGGPVFVAASVNLSLTPNVPLVAEGSGPEVDLSSVDWGAAMGWRALERPAPQGALHDIHLLLELGGARTDTIEDGQRTRSTEVLFAPGMRYGFLSRGGWLAEIGVSFPIGLTPAAPDWGVILQVQFEWPGLF